jgi:hypothetical protein
LTQADVAHARAVGMLSEFKRAGPIIEHRPVHGIGRGEQLDDTTDIAPGFQRKRARPE